MSHPSSARVGAPTFTQRIGAFFRHVTQAAVRVRWIWKRISTSLNDRGSALDRTFPKLMNPHGKQELKASRDFWKIMNSQCRLGHSRDNRSTIHEAQCSDTRKVAIECLLRGGSDRTPRRSTANPSSCDASADGMPAGQQVYITDADRREK